MLTIGPRSNPLVLNLILIGIIILAMIVYTIIAISIGNWSWFSNCFSEATDGISMNCLEKTFQVDPASLRFSTMTLLLNKTLPGKNRWDPLNMSVEM